MPAPKSRSKSAKKPSPLELMKEEINKKQTQIDELNDQIASVKNDLGLQGTEEKRLRLKLQIILPEILAHRDRERYPLEPLNDVVDVDEGYVRQMVQTIIDDLRGRQSQKSEIEERIEELEHRVTEQNNNYQGINEAMKSSSPHEIKFLLKRLKQDLLLEEPLTRPISAPVETQTQLYNLTHNGIVQNHDYSPSPHRGTESTRGSSRLFNLTQLPPIEDESPMADLNAEYLRSMETGFVSLPRPVRKYSGDTHIKLMIPQIRQAICDELSIEKSHRGDWRHFGHLIGISTETIQFWRRLQLRAPMDQVLSFWKAHHTSDVRLLHRLLMSPQVRAMNLAKLVSEFYHVD